MKNPNQIIKHEFENAPMMLMPFRIMMIILLYPLMWVSYLFLVYDIKARREVIDE